MELILKKTNFDLLFSFHIFKLPWKRYKNYFGTYLTYIHTIIHIFCSPYWLFLFTNFAKITNSREENVFYLSGQDKLQLWCHQFLCTKTLFNFKSLNWKIFIHRIDVQDIQWPAWKDYEQACLGWMWCVKVCVQARVNTCACMKRRIQK